MPGNGDLIEFYRRYGTSSFADDEPAYAEVCAHLGEHPELIEIIAAHDPKHSNPICCLLQCTICCWADLSTLQQIYDGTSQPVTPVFADAVVSNRRAIDELLKHQRTQTNEVGRCAILALMLNDAQRRTQQPLAWLDLGASGGLNLNLDQFRIAYRVSESTVTTGDPGAALTLHCDVRNGSPTISPSHAEIAWRLGVDESPVDVADPDQARWLQACLWPSQPARHARLADAIAIAQAHPVHLIAADAAAGVARALELAPAGAAFVMTTTWVWYYLPESTQQAVLQLLRDSARRVHWYSLEGPGVVVELGQPPEREVIDSLVGRVEVGGEAEETAEVLGLSHPHGAWLDWYADI